MSRWLGRTVEVLVEGLSEDSDLVWVGRTAQQAPEVDGITYLSGFEPEQVRPVRFDGAKLSVGALVLDIPAKSVIVVALDQN